jgi:hypothetical protein
MLGSSPEALWIGISVFIVVLAACVIVWRHLHPPPDSAEVERLRRAAIHRDGKMGDAEIMDVDSVSHPGSILIVYSYSVAGVIYTTSQEVMVLRSLLPADLMTMVGPVMIKFDPRNPANSIVLCEEWSGLRNRERSQQPLDRPVHRSAGDERR